jgi:hypothetical protein
MSFFIILMNLTDIYKVIKIFSLKKRNLIFAVKKIPFSLQKKLNCKAAKLSNAYFFNKDPVKHYYLILEI